MHLSETPNGWRAIVQHKGQRRSVTARTRAEAQRRGAALIVALGGDPTASDMTVGEMVADYLADLERRASPKYFDEAERAANRIPTTFADRQASKITGMHLDALYRQLEATLPNSAIRRIHTVVMAAYGRAVELGALSAAPKVGKPEQSSPDVKPPSDEQAKAVLDAVEGLEHVALRLAAVTGCRRGEIVALQWDDFDLDRCRVHIRRSLVIARRQVSERPTKTGRKGHRVIGLDQPTVALLRQHRREQIEGALAHGLPAPVWVVSDDGRTPWRPDRLSAVFADARNRAGMSGITLHGLRHYVATSMLADGEPPAKVAQRLGHTSVITTTRVYAHWIDSDDSEAAERHAARLSS